MTSTTTNDAMMKLVESINDNSNEAARYVVETLSRGFMLEGTMMMWGGITGAILMALVFAFSTKKCLKDSDGWFILALLSAILTIANIFIALDGWLTQAAPDFAAIQYILESIQ